MGRVGRPAVQIVADALTATPQATAAAELAADTGLGATTVGNALTLLEQQGRARRTPGGRDAGRRLPDQWTPATAAAAEVGEVGEQAVREPKSPQPASPHGREARLGRGQLDGLVLDQLGANGSQPMTAGAVAKALDRSAGAVSNCLQRLTANQRVRLVEQAPRRYTLSG